MLRQAGLLIPPWWAADTVSLSQRFPELNQLETKEERQAVFKAALKKVSTRPRYWLPMILVSMTAAAFVPTISLLIGRIFSVPPRLRESMIFGLVMGSLLAGWRLAFRGSIQKQIRVEMIARGIPVCMGCGYDLRGQVEPRCPECGRPFS